MLKTEDNEILTRVGPGTPMGNLLRRYWMPACLSAEIAEPGGGPARVRLLAENLVAFRDTTGRAGLLREGPPGQACPVHESGGIVWAYLGPRETMTPFRDFATDALAPGEYLVTKQLTTCNWVQGMEGTIDTAHISYLHQWAGAADLPDDGTDKPGYPSHAMSWRIWWHDRAPRVEVEDTWYGYQFAGIRTTPNGHTYVQVSSFAVPNITVVATVPFTEGIGLYVPIDDENTWCYILLSARRSDPLSRPGTLPATPFAPPTPPGPDGIVPRRHTADNDYLIDRQVQRALSFTGVSDFASQDFMVTESMGPIYDRSQEQLGATDKPVTRMRHILLRAAKGLAEGGEPPAVAGGLDYGSIRGAEKILEPGEDWHILGTNDDPVVREALGL